MTLLFGELRNLTSRAVWSDDEEEDDEQEQDEGMSLQTINFDLVSDEKLQSFRDIYFSLSNYSIKHKHLSKVGDVTTKRDGLEKRVADLIKLNNNSLWIRWKDQTNAAINHVIVETLNNFLTNLWSTIENPNFMIISKLFSRTSSVQVLSCHKDKSKTKLHEEFSPLLTPSMVTNISEAAIFEFCTIFNKPCHVFILPDENTSKEMTINLPSPILQDVFSTTKSYTNSNIYV